MKDEHQKSVTRRRLVAGAGTAGVLAAAVAALPSHRERHADPAPVSPAAQQGGGYRESEHVLRYYQTARV